MNKELIDYYKPCFDITYKPKYTGEKEKKATIKASCKLEAKSNFYKSDEYLNCKEIIKVERE